MNKTLFFLLLCLSQIAFPPARCRGQATTAQDSDQTILLNNKAYWLFGRGHYDESIALVKQAIQKNDNVISNFLLCNIYNTEQNYAEAVKYGERAVKLDSSYTNIYPQLFTAYYGTERWQDAERVSEKAQKYGSNNDTEAMLKVIDFSVKAEAFSKIMACLLFIVLAIVFFNPIYRASKKGTNYFLDYDRIRASEIILISLSVSCVLWLIFFALSKWIWSFNPPIVSYEIVNYVRGFIFEHDGIQSFFLYSMMFVNLMASLAATSFLLKFKNNPNVYYSVFTVLLLISGCYLFRIGFQPPLTAIEPANVFLPAGLVLLCAGLYYLYGKNSLLAKIVVVLCVSFTGLIALGPSSTVDFMFLLAPALRLLHGFTIRETYFQYDLYLSLLLLAWMKMKIAIDWFPYVGQVSYFLLFLGAFFFSDRFFKSKGLSVLFIIGFVLVRFYTIWADNPTIIQVTPMRLDLWIILLLVVGKKGVHHWLVGFFLGLLVLFHRNLGIIYTMAYVELLAVLFILDIVPLLRDKRLNINSLSSIFLKHVRAGAVNIILIVSSVALCFILFHEMFSKSALLYTKLGLGLKPIEKTSFYGYVSVLLGCLISFIIYFRNRLGEKYVATALFVTLLVIGNSMYFFGRSHENNILNISGILVIALFVLFDILIFLAPEDKPVPRAAPPAKGKKPVAALEQAPKFRFTNKMVYLLLPLIFIFLVGYAYSVRIVEKAKTQYANLLDLNFAFPFPAIPIDTAAVRQITHDSKKVYIIDFWYDTYYYYYNDYAPQGFFSPCQSWVYKKDLVPFLQGLLDQGYYIAYDIREYNRYVEYFSCLNYNQSVQKGYIVAITKENTKFMLPPLSSDLLHVATRDTLANNGLDYLPVKLKDEFTVEVVMKPFDPQMPNASIIDNLSTFDGTKGFTFRLNSTYANQFVFGFSNGTGALPNSVFLLDYNKWYYIAITVNKQFLTIYKNGVLLSQVSSGGLPIANCENDIVIGSQSNLSTRFRGNIKEVRISDGNIAESDIKKNMEVIKDSLKDFNP